jgi:hypothetical protein
MDEATSGEDRQIDAGEANRLAQEINRQTYSDLPEFTPDAEQAAAPEQSHIEDVERDPPDRNLEERVWPPVRDTPTVIGGDPGTIAALREEERR